MKRHLTPGRVARGRRGSFLVVALVCLVIAMALIAGLLTLVRTHRQQLQVQHRQSQAEWLAQSALDRAAAQLRADGGYSGETWSPDASEMGGPDAGEAIIRVEQSPDRKDERLIRAEASYPAGSTTIRRTRRTTLVLPDDS